MRVRRFAACKIFAMMLLVSKAVDAKVHEQEKKRPVTVADGIEMTRLAYADYVSGVSPEGIVAEFSPDGKQFAMILRKGVLKNGVNEFALLRFRTGEVFRSPKPDVLVRFSSSSNRDGISRLRWLADNETLVFLGERCGEVSQIYALNVRTRKLRRLTSHQTAIRNYDVTPSGQTLLFLADPQESKTQSSQKEILIDGQWLPDLLAQKYAIESGEEAFLQTKNGPTVRLPVGNRYFLHLWSRLSLSPNGRYAVVGASPREIPTSWSVYPDTYVQTVLSHGQFKGATPSSSVALLFDRKEAVIAPVLNAPANGYKGNISVRWAANGRFFFLRTYLPPEMLDPGEKGARKEQPYSVEVKVPSREISQVNDLEWSAEKERKGPLDVRVEESINSAPQIVVVNRNTHQQALLLDLNPTFRELDFGNVEILDLKLANQLTVKCGLYLPPHYVPGTRYPLVIQTHGFDPERFSMDGRREWSSGYAARALAAMGMVVLQTFGFKDQNDALHHKSDGAFGVSREQAERNLNRMVYEKAIDSLDGRGLIDRDLVGLVGFSRTVCFVAYTLTHSDYRFAAASLVDGIDCGYFQEIAYPQSAWDFDLINGGAPPFGEGLPIWLQESPSFFLNKVNTPVSLLALKPANVLVQWEWYAGLTLQHKPVDFVLIPDAGDGDNHLLTKPWERMIAEQRLVDWFRFWLKGEEDPEPGKASQYQRWRELREVQRKSQPRS